MLPDLVTKDYRRTTLKRRHKPVVRALGEAFFSHDGEVPADELDALVEEVDRFISPASKTLRFGLVLMLDILRWAPLLSGRLAAFEDLPVDDRVHVLERLERSTIVQLPLLVVGYKTLMCLLFYEAPEQLRAMGYSEERKRHLTLPIARPEPRTERRAPSAEASP